MQTLSSPDAIRSAGSQKSVDTLLSPVGLSQLTGRTVGFSLSLLPKGLRRRARQNAQRLPDRHVAWGRFTGANYIVLARMAEP